MKKLVVILTALLGLASSASAQSSDTFYPGWKMSALGGVNYVSSDGWTVGFIDQVSPAFQVGLEYDFLPWLGLRFTGSGMTGKYPTNPFNEHQYTAVFNYGQVGADAMFDFSNMASYKYARVVNPYGFVGAGANYRFKTGSSEQYTGPAFRVGFGFNLRLSNTLKLALEGQYNALGNTFNTLDDNNILGGLMDDNILALLGLQFDLGGRRRRAEEAAHAEQVAAARAAQAAAAQATAERIAAARAAQEREAEERRAQREAEAAAYNPSAAQEIIIFGYYEYTVPARESGKLRHLVSVLNQNPDAVIVLSGYSDEESESEMPAMQLSKLRLDAVMKVLTDAGIDGSRITAVNYGFEKAESANMTHNRLVICETQ